MIMIQTFKVSLQSEHMISTFKFTQSKKKFTENSIMYGPTYFSEYDMHIWNIYILFFW